MTPSEAAGAQVAAAAGGEGRKVTGAIRHQHFDPTTQKWRTGSLPHSSVTVEIRVDKSMYDDDPEWESPLRDQKK